MKKLVLLVALFFAIGMQANTIKEKQNIKTHAKKIEMPENMQRFKCKSETQTSESNDAPQTVNYVQKPGDWCDWWAGVYVSEHDYASDSDRAAARTAYYDRCMEDGGDHA